MSTAVERGCLLLADISGYSAYLAGVELEHSADILADLLGAVVEQTQGPFTIAKLEGDAVFAYAMEGVESEVVFATLEAAYATFASRTRTIGITSTCPCRACKGVGDLDLKFIIHYGEFARHEVARSAEVVGSDVVLAHRLLKNSVTESGGPRGYALFTDAAMSSLGLGAHDIGMIRHVEHYTDIEDVPGWVIDLATRWAASQALHPVFVTLEEAYQTYVCDTSLDPATIWELTTVPARLKLWLAKDRAEPENPHGVQGVGSKVHCVHGHVVWENEILDWRPYHYYSGRAIDRYLGEFTFTQEILAVGHGQWRAEMRVRPAGGRKQRVLLALFGFMQRREMRAATERFRTLVGQLEAQRAQGSDT